MTTTNEPRDDAEERAADLLQKLKGHLANAEVRYKEAKGAAVSHDGNLRRHTITRAAERFVEIEVLKERIADAEAKLKAAQDDFPRREALRKEAAEADAEAAKAEADLTKMRDEAARIEHAVAEKRDAAQRARVGASRVGS